MQAVRREGKRIRTGLMEVRVVASPLCHARVGVVVPKYRHGSVERNLVKRRLRELTRLRLLPALAGGAALDVVIRAAPAAYTADYDRLDSDVQRVIRELARLRPRLPLPLPLPAAPPGPSGAVAAPEMPPPSQGTE